MSSLDSLEQQLRDRLAGCRLVCEIGIDESLHRELVEAFRWLAQANWAGAPAQLVHRFPALTVAYLTAEGVYRYELNALWSRLSVPELDSAVLGPAFEKALSKLDLDSFEFLVDSGARRYLAPILAHGGIPRYCLGDFFRLLLDEVRRGASDAVEVIARWRSARTGFTAIDRPVQRFLLHGGDVSVDFLDRCLDMVGALAKGAAVDAAEIGLPGYVVEAFAEFEPAARSAVRASHHVMLPRPEVSIDAWSGGGPTMLLPALPSEFRGGYWQLYAADTVRRFDGAAQERQVPLPPARAWSCDLHDVDGGRLRTFTFSGFDSGQLLFFHGTSGALLHDPTRLREPVVWILHAAAQGALFSPERGTTLALAEEFPPLRGEWSACILNAYDLSGLTRIATTSEAGAPATLVAVRALPVSLEGTVVKGVTTEDRGLPVYSGIPSLRFAAPEGVQAAARWRVRLECNGQEYTAGGEAILQAQGGLLSEWLPANRIAICRLTVHGPLGSDLREEFAVIPGLEIRVSQALHWPTDRPASVLVRFAGGAPRAWTVPQGTDLVTATLSDTQAGQIAIGVTVPVLQWALLYDGAMGDGLGQRQVRLSADGLLEGKQAVLLVRTRTPGLAIVLELQEDGVTLQKASSVTSGDEGRWSFDLLPFSDTIRQSTALVLTWQLSVGHRALRVGVAAREANLEVLDAHQWVSHGRTEVVVRFREPRPFRRRVLRLWPLSHPWRDRIEQLIPDGTTEPVTVEATAEVLAPGTYIVEVTVQDDWIRAARPLPQAPGVLEMRLGTSEDEAAWRRSLPSPTPLTALANASAGQPATPLQPDSVSSIASAAIDALATFHQYFSRWRDSAGCSEAIVRICRPGMNALLDALVGKVATGEVPARTALGIALEVAPQILRGEGAIPSPDQLDALWEVAPGLAVAAELRAAGGISQTHLEAAIGVELSALPTVPLLPPPRQLQPFMTMPKEQLESLQSHVQLAPRRALDADNQAAVQFEWLSAMHRGHLDVLEPQQRYRSLADRLPPLGRSMEDAVRATYPPSHLLGAFPEIGFPSVALAAVVHLLAPGGETVLARKCLHGLAESTPGLVNRLMVVVSLLLYHNGEMQ